jgi:hypothetical protein
VRRWLILALCLVPLPAIAAAFLLAAPSSGPLDLNFASNTTSGQCASFAACLSTTRASFETCTSSTGAVTYATSGNPCITSAGLQVFAAATNVLQHSQGDFAAWTVGNVTVTDNNATAPDGNATASTLAASSGTVTYVIAAPAFTFASGSVYVLSAWFKPGTLGFAQLTFPSAQFSGVGYADITISGCTISATGGTLVGDGISSYSNGWCRAWIAATATASSSGAAGDIVMIPASNSTRAPSWAATGQNIVVWGAQTEVAQSATVPFPTPYIPTTTASVTRNADNISATGGLATLLGKSIGTIVADTSLAPQSLAATIIDANGTSLMAKNAGNNCLTNVGATLTSSNTATWSGAVDCGLAWDGTGGILDLNATTVTDSTARAPVGTFSIGSTAGSSNFFNGNITRLTGYPTKQSSPQ